MLTCFGLVIPYGMYKYVNISLAFFWHSSEASLIGNAQDIYPWYEFIITRKISNIRRTKSTNLNVSRRVLQLSLPNPGKPGVKSGMKM